MSGQPALRKLWRPTAQKQFTVTRAILSAVARDQRWPDPFAKETQNSFLESDLRIQPWIFLKKRTLMTTRILLRAIFISHVLTFF